MQNIFSNISLTVMIQRNNADICMSLMSSSYVCESIFLLFVKVNLSTSGDGHFTYKQSSHNSVIAF
jgi:hypothetical protein